MIVVERRRFPVVVESAVFAGRLMTLWRRNPLVPLQSALFPTILLIVYYLLVSRSMMRLTGSDNVDTVVSMCAVAGGMSGSVAAALSIPVERRNGLMARFWVMPVHRASALTGTLLAEAVRTVVATVVIVAVGMILGMRFHGGLAAAVVFVTIPVLWVTVYATVVILVALRSRSVAMLTWLNGVSLGAVFASSGVAPLELFPAWLRPVVRYQPMSATIQSMTDLARGSVSVQPLLLTFAWIAGLGVVAGVLVMRGYRAAVRAA
ncbi:ABC transporter permease [Mycobacterium yunnanensis]|uniref:ABC transporter permease n=1 Tax=Mycobacterium yunnanensis TaxID=368477 RepID=A0A9X2Z5P3_9MYCO|nr:ABC transporter permease [Mycobacterium yunnanensis]MCV7422844.1 ABC transporter permease [Mycobacterium yunnanensis]